MSLADLCQGKGFGLRLTVPMHLSSARCGSAEDR